MKTYPFFAGYDSLRKDHFNKHFDEENDFYYFSQVKAQSSKNPKGDKQNLKEGGIIPFGKTEFELDLGLFIELYLSHLDPANPYFFQKPMLGKQFQIHKDETKIYYYSLKGSLKVGHNTVKQMMPKVCSLKFF